jgi:hypothetical protein
LTFFVDKDTCKDAIFHPIHPPCAVLTSLVHNSLSSQYLHALLYILSRFHHPLYRNPFLIHAQPPEATKVSGYKTWQTEFDRHVKEGEQAIWIWAPIIARQCPECGDAPSYHEDSDCTYAESPPEEWSKGPVAFRPVSVGDVSRRGREASPEGGTDARRGVEARVADICGVSGTLDISLRRIDATAWDYGKAQGVCHTETPPGEPIRVEIKDRENTAAMAGTLIHEYAHALLHTETDETPNIPDERAKREVEAEAVAYIVGRYLGLNMSGSAFYLAAWQDEDPGAISARLGRITATANSIITALDE